MEVITAAVGLINRSEEKSPFKSHKLQTNLC